MNDLYLDLLKKCLTDSIYGNGIKNDWTTRGHTMIGIRRLNNLQECIENVLKDGVPGDFIETGVWRGGACIFMRAMLKVYGPPSDFWLGSQHRVKRNVWVADSFAGLPIPKPDKYPADTRNRLYEIKELRVSLNEVKANFAKYGLLDDQVKFLEGWFCDTLPTASIEKLAILRLDGDLYESTMDALVNLYPKLSPGGYCIVDDYNVIWGCTKATNDYCKQNHIEGLNAIDPTDYREGCFWKKQ